MCIVCFNCECEETKCFQLRWERVCVFAHVQGRLASIQWILALVVYFVLI